MAAEVIAVGFLCQPGVVSVNRSIHLQQVPGSGAYVFVEAETCGLTILKRDGLKRDGYVATAKRIGHYGQGFAIG